MKDFQSIAEIMVKTTLSALSKADRKRLIDVAHKKPYTVPSDLFYICEGMIGDDGQLTRDIQEVLKRS